MTLAAILAGVLVLGSLVLALKAPRDHGARRGRGALRKTGKRLYTRRNALRLGAATAGAAVLAYSGADEAFERWHTREVRTERTRRPAEELKQFGEPYWAGVWVVMALVDRFVGSSVVSRFGRRCFEATALGLPVLWSTQRLLGGSRPTDEHGPRFRPFADENSASGHTFISAVPLLVLARTLRPASARALAGVLSPLTGWSRLHDRKHYLSQVILGWAIAWEASGAAVAAASAQEHAEPAQSTPVESGQA